MEIPDWFANSRNEFGHPERISQAADTSSNRSPTFRWSPDSVRVASSLNLPANTAHFPAEAEIARLARFRRNIWQIPLSACSASITGMACTPIFNVPVRKPPIKTHEVLAGEMVGAKVDKSSWQYQQIFKQSNLEEILVLRPTPPGQGGRLHSGH